MIVNNQIVSANVLKPWSPCTNEFFAKLFAFYKPYFDVGCNSSSWINYGAVVEANYFHKLSMISQWALQLCIHVAQSEVSLS